MNELGARSRKQAALISCSGTVKVQNLWLGNVKVMDTEEKGTAAGC